MQCKFLRYVTLSPFNRRLCCQSPGDFLKSGIYQLVQVTSYSKEPEKNVRNEITLRDSWTEGHNLGNYFDIKEIFYGFIRIVGISVSIKSRINKFRSRGSLLEQSFSSITGRQTIRARGTLATMMPNAGCQDDKFLSFKRRIMSYKACLIPFARRVLCTCDVKNT